MHKGIVMEMTDRHIVVMRSDGKFDRISRKTRACEIGEEIVYASSGINWRSPSVAEDPPLRRPSFFLPGAVRKL